MKVNENGNITVEGSHGSVEIDPKNYPSLNFSTSQSERMEADYGKVLSYIESPLSSGGGGCRLLSEEEIDKEFKKQMGVENKEVKAKGELIKCFQITPSGDRQHDSIIVEAGETWEPALAYAERVLDGQFSELEESGKQWEDISVEIRCIRMPALE